MIRPALVITAMLLLILSVSCSDEPVTRYEFLMDTQCSITVYDAGDEAYIATSRSRDTSS